jgi:isopenicillin N synthase-like dioxygenase
MFVSSFIHYPAVSAQRLRSGDVVRNLAHSDLGSLTLLFQQDVGGLQVADMSSTDKTTRAAVERDGNFMHVNPRPGAIIVNIGYLLVRWTNGRWKNTVYRAVATSYAVTNSMTQRNDDSQRMILERYSVAFFGFPDAATIVEPLPTCCGEQEPKKWRPIIQASTFSRDGKPYILEWIYQLVKSEILQNHGHVRVCFPVPIDEPILQAES